MWETIAIFLITSIVGTVVWGIRLEGRVSTLDALHSERIENGTELVEVKLESIDKRLERIERAMNGFLHEHRSDHR